MTTHPAALATWIESNPRNQAIDDHGFMLRIGKWNDMVSHLPGTPLAGEDGGTDPGLISRSGLFRLAGPARQDETGVAALHLFWQSLAWGTGNSHRKHLGESHPSQQTQKVQDGYCAMPHFWLPPIQKLLSGRCSQTGRR